MTTNTFTQILVLVLLILMSAYFSATETAFSSFNKIKLKNLAASGNKKAALVLSLAKDYDKLLSTILIGNNIVNIASASMATAIFVFHFGDIGITLSTIVMTILVLIFGEISPKSIAKDAPDSFAMFSAPILKCFVLILSPLNFLFMIWKKFLSKIFKVTDNNVITDDELLTIVDEAQAEGGIDETEGELIKNAIEFNDLDAEDIFKPRVDVIAIPITAPKDVIDKTFMKTGYSRLPVYEGTIDNIIGILHLKDFYNKIMNSDKNIANVLKTPTFITPNMKIPKILTLLKQNKSHLAIITDEFGGTVGILTLEDILEELVGDIWDEHDEIIEDFIKIEDNKYRIMGNASLEKMFELFSINLDSEINTVSGWVIEMLNDFPKKDDTFSFEHLDIIISKVNNRRVVEIIVNINEMENTNLKGA